MDKFQVNKVQRSKPLSSLIHIIGGKRAHWHVAVSDHKISIWCKCMLRCNCFQFWGPQFRKDIEMFKEGWWRVWSTYPMKSCWGSFGLFSWRKGGSGGELITLYNNLKRDCGQLGVSLFFQATSDRSAGHSLKLHQGRFSWTSWRRFHRESDWALE